MKRILIVFAVLTVGLGIALAWKLADQKAQERRPPGSSGVVEGTRVVVAVRLATRVLKMNAAEGETVEAGTVLAELDCSEPDALVEEADARIRAAEEQVDLARAQAEVVSTQAKAAVRQAAGVRAQIGSLRVQGENARRQSDRAEKLKAESALAAATSETAETAARDLSHRVEAASAAADAAALSAKALDRQAGASLVQVEMAQRQLDAGRAAAKRASALQAECRIVAPRKGVVTLRAREPGEAVLPGTVLYEITDNSEMEVRFYVTNEDLDKVTPGRAVDIAVDAIEGERYSGSVVRVSREAEFTPRTVQTRSDRDRLVYAVFARLENPRGTLLSGMPVEVVVR